MEMTPQGNDEQNTSRNNYFEKVWLTPLPPSFPHAMSALFPFEELTDPTPCG
jgi:hypothetical protein